MPPRARCPTYLATLFISPSIMSPTIFLIVYLLHFCLKSVTNGRKENLTRPVLPLNWPQWPVLNWSGCSCPRMSYPLLFPQVKSMKLYGNWSNWDMNHDTIPIFFSKLMYLWERERDRPSACFLSKWLQQPGLGQEEAKSQELHLCLPQRWQEPTNQAILLPLQMHYKRANLEAKEPGCKPVLPYGMSAIQAMA